MNRRRQIRVPVVAALALTSLLISLGACSSAGATRPPPVKATPLSPYLRPATSIEVFDCEQAARSVGLDVLCPLVLPQGQYVDPWCGVATSPCGYHSVYGVSFLAQVVFTAPSGYVGQSAGLGHFVVWANTQGRRIVIPCLVGRKVGSVESGGRPWGVWHCGTQSSKGTRIEFRDGRQIVDGGEVMQDHLVFVTTVKDTNTEVSLHGITAVNFRLLVQITAHMQPSAVPAG